MKLLAEIIRYFDGFEISSEGYNLNRFSFENLGLDDRAQMRLMTALPPAD